MAGGAGAGRRAAAPRRAAWWAVLGACALLVLAGCTGSDESAGSGGSAPEAARPAGGGGGTEQSAAGPGAPDTGAGAGQADTGLAGLRLEQPALIRTADLTVRVDDVAARARQAQQHARAAGGTVAGDNRSGSGDEATADLVLKVQPERLDAVLDQLAGLGEEEGRTSSTQDVTEQVADVRSRVATMEASIARVRAILARATRIGDVVAVEGQLSRRVTELESLQARQRVLAAQAEYATITLHLHAAAAPAAPAQDRTGFLGGLQDGWRAFTATVGWLLTGLGAVLPFLLVAVPATLAARWALRRSRRPAPLPAADPPAAS